MLTYADECVQVAEEQPEEPADMPEGAGHTLDERLKDTGWKVRPYADV
jgi:hypothetical protein